MRQEQVECVEICGLAEVSLRLVVLSRLGARLCSCACGLLGLWCGRVLCISGVVTAALSMWAMICGALAPGEYVHGVENTFFLVWTCTGGAVVSDPFGDFRTVAGG